MLFSVQNLGFPEYLLHIPGKSCAELPAKVVPGFSPDE